MPAAQFRCGINTLELEIEISIQEIASMLIAFDRHHDWMSKEVKIRPKSGSMLLYSRKKVNILVVCESG